MFLEAEGNVVGDVQVQVAVLVGIQKTSAGTHLMARRHAGLARDVGERAVAVVAVEYVRAEVVQVKIQIAVVVVVARGTRQARIRVSPTPGLLGHIGESPVAIVAIQARFGGLRRPLCRATVPR